MVTPTSFTTGQLDYSDFVSKGVNQIQPNMPLPIVTTPAAAPSFDLWATIGNFVANHSVDVIISGIVLASVAQLWYNFKHKQARIGTILPLAGLILSTIAVWKLSMWGAIGTGLACVGFIWQDAVYKMNKEENVEETTQQVVAPQRPIAIKPAPSISAWDDVQLPKMELKLNLF